MSKPKHHYHFLDIYNLDVCVAVNKKQFKHMKKKFGLRELNVDNPPAGATYGFYHSRGGAQVFVLCFWINAKMWRRSGADTYKLAEICAHEASHGFGSIWRHVGGTMDHSTFHDDEPAPYLLGWLTAHLMKLALEDK